MPAFHTGPVRAVLSERPGIQKIEVDLSASGRGEAERGKAVLDIPDRLSVIS